MIGYIKSAGLLAVLLFVSFPTFSLAQSVNFSVFPTEVSISNLATGEAAQFQLTIHNKELATHNFTLTTFQPSEAQRRQDMGEFPDANWISFSPTKIQVPTQSQANVTVTLAVPREKKWADKNWEIWLGVAPESIDLVGVKFYVRLLVSTKPEGRGEFMIRLFIAIAITIVLLSYGVYYFTHKVKPK